MNAKEEIQRETVLNLALFSNANSIVHFNSLVHMDFSSPACYLNQYKPERESSPRVLYHPLFAPPLFFFFFLQIRIIMS